jgi:hypothetical protein
MTRMSLFISILVGLLIVLLAGGAAFGSKGGRPAGTNGVPLYVIIEVEWNAGDGLASWTVWGPQWDPVIGGTPLTSCTDCLEIATDYTFRANGKIVQFRETMVSTVNANPQSKQVVLYDPDGDGTYVGSLSSWNYFPWWTGEDNASDALYFDRIDYQVTFDQAGNLVHFRYLEYEHKKLKG